MTLQGHLKSSDRKMIMSRMLFAALLLVGVAAAQVVDQDAPKPHIIALVVDDFGWANIGYHRENPDKEVQTPNMNQLVAEGIELDRAYSFKFCSPSRSSFQSGRLPVHVNVLNIDPKEWNPKDPVSGFQGIPRNMTGIATKLRSAGYRTHQVGKWDAGMATPDHTPQGRGYETSFGYFHHDNDYWTEKVENFVDLWNTSAPAYGQNGTAQNHTGPESEYEEHKFAQHVYRILETHDPSEPLFLNYDFHIVHEPLQTPQAYFDKFDFMTNDYQNHRQIYASMVNYADTVIGNLTAILKNKGMWDNTLITLQSDNGGPSFAGSSHTANNYPLKGTKMSNWEGGTRVNAFVSGGYVKTAAPSKIGTKVEGYSHIADFYATFCALAGVDKTDARAAAAGLPPVDSMNMWPYWSGQVDNSPRTEIHMDQSAAIVGDYKVLVGDHPDACWMGPMYPNGTDDPSCKTVEHCGITGCLYNIKEDPYEYNNLASSMPDKLAEMVAALSQLNTKFFDPDRDGGDEQMAAKQAIKNGGFWGPFLP